MLLYSYWNIVSAQTVINDYAAVLGTSPCGNTYQVDDATNFSIGDTVLIIQMKGAIIDTTNTANFGSVLNYRGAGHYEYNIIRNIIGNTISLWFTTINNFNIPDGKVQFVRVPSFNNYTINQPHSCLPWNGVKGGVFAIYTSGTLTINSSINITGMGFRGGQVPLTTQYSGCNHSDYFYPATGNLAAQKGEGIAEISMLKMYGRGALANGGGGGGNHNAGGAGGGNAGIGGKGGNQYQLNICNPIILDIGGLGGISTPYTSSSNRIFLGGGGGAGHGNDLSEKPGATGGGIAVINCGNIISALGSIISNGADATECNAAILGCMNDATGGGGGGGAVLIKSGGYTGNLDIKVRGGKGANVWMGPTTPVGPGGGGGGGAILFAQSTVPLSVNNDLTGGTNGVLPQFSNSAWGAQPGQSGQVATGLQLLFPSDTFNSGQLVADFTDAEVNCYTRNFFDNSQSNSSTINSWTWTFPDNSTSSQQNPTYTFPGYGTYNVTLVVTDNNGCSESITKPIVIEYVRFASAGNDTTICAGAIANVNASGGVAYSWSPAAQMSTPTLPSSNVNISAPTIFTVIVTDNRGCVDKDSVLVNVNNGPDVKIISDDNNISCNSQFVQLKVEGAQSYVWQPAEFCNDSTSSSPIVSPTNTTTFLVTGTDQYGCISTDTITIVVYKGDAQIFMPNAFSPNMDGNNDEIKPLILCDFTLEVFSIYNRWGQRVFVTQSMGKGWNGLFKDKTADVGSYFYLIKGKDGQGKAVTLKGDITLVR